MNVVILQDLVKRYRDKTALRGINLELQENCIVGLIGRNGAGKTTLMRTLAGYLKPTEGTALVFGEKPFDNIHVLSNIMYMDDDRFRDSDTLRDLLDRAALSYSRFDKALARRINIIIDFPRPVRNYTAETFSIVRLFGSFRELLDNHVEILICVPMNYTFAE